MAAVVVPHGLVGRPAHSLAEVVPAVLLPFRLRLLLLHVVVTAPRGAGAAVVGHPLLLPGAPCRLRLGLAPPMLLNHGLHSSLLGAVPDRVLLSRFLLVHQL